MPREKRPKPIYERGGYKLYPARAGRTNLEIIWYDAARKRERSASAGTSSEREGRLAVDRLYLASAEGQGFCPTCGRPHDAAAGGFIYASAAIADYLTARERSPSHEALKDRLGHVLMYIAGTNPNISVTQIDEAWVARFRKHELARPIVSKTGAERPRAAGTVENSVVALAAAIRLSGNVPLFKPLRPKDVSTSPLFRADIKMLAAMFRFCTDPKAPAGEEWSDKMVERIRQHRYPLLQFLRISIATWCRPDAAYDFSTDPKRRQWLPVGPAIALNPHGRRQTRKVRPTVPAPKQIVPLMEATKGKFVGVANIKRAWLSMCDALGLPGDGEAGTKLIRRSVSTIARRRIGEANWVQGETMLGHRAASTSDIYALPDPAHLGLALAATEAIIDDIEALAPGAFTAGLPRAVPALSLINGGKNG